VIAGQACVAASFASRLRGLLGRKSFLHGEALILPACCCVHMFFMRFPIDILFCSSEHRIVRIVENLRPWTISPIIFAAEYVVELPAGTVKLRNITPGDVLILE